MILQTENQALQKSYPASFHSTKRPGSPPQLNRNGK
jgi:hypothetical protein